MIVERHGPVGWLVNNRPAQLNTINGAMRDMGLTGACRSGARHLASLWGHPDREEGPRAFAEKREPAWAWLAPTEDL